MPDFAVEVSKLGLRLRAVWNANTSDVHVITSKGPSGSMENKVVGSGQRGGDGDVTVFWCLRDKAVGGRVCEVCSLHSVTARCDGVSMCP